VEGYHLDLCRRADINIQRLSENEPFVAITTSSTDMLSDSVVTLIDNNMESVTAMDLDNLVDWLETPHTSHSVPSHGLKEFLTLDHTAKWPI